MSKHNNPASDSSLPRNFRPMSDGQLKLEVPEREGWFRYWFRGTPDRIARAQAAGFQFVNRGDVQLNNFDLGGDVTGDGNTDMGTRVSRPSGDIDAYGNAVPLVLMECPNELHEMSEKIVMDRNASIASALTKGIVGAENESASDTANRYVGKIPDFFNPNKRR